MRSGLRRYMSVGPPPTDGSTSSVHKEKQPCTIKPLKSGCVLQKVAECLRAQIVSKDSRGCWRREQGENSAHVSSSLGGCSAGADGPDNNREGIQNTTRHRPERAWQPLFWSMPQESSWSSVSDLHFTGEKDCMVYRLQHPQVSLTSRTQKEDPMLLPDAETLKLCPMSRELPSAKGGKQYKRWPNAGRIRLST
jgi:hypothetical protein